MNSNIVDILKFAHVQLAAEALFTFRAKRRDADKTPGTVATYSPIEKADLVAGNLRSSRFTEHEAEQFLDEWSLVEHKSNTTTGFSGTLFKSKTGELVLSFRSEEFGVRFQFPRKRI